MCIVIGIYIIAPPLKMRRSPLIGDGFAQNAPAHKPIILVNRDATVVGAR